MLRVSLSNFAAIDSLTVDSEPYLELPPSSAVVVTGRSGAGKTLLVWALYYAPLVLAEGLTSRFSVEAASIIRGVANFVARVTGTWELLFALRSGKAKVKFCVTRPVGEPACVRVSSESCCRDIEYSVLRQMALMVAIPLQFRALAYTAALMHGELAKALRVLVREGYGAYSTRKVLDKLEEEDRDAGMIARLVLARSLPPIRVRGVAGGWSVLEALGMDDLLGGEDAVAMLEVGEGYDVRASWSRIGRLLLSYAVRVLEAGYRRMLERDRLLTPILVLDDAFDDYVTGDAVALARRLERLAQRGYSILVTTHHAEIPALASEADGLWELLIATYGIDALSRIARVPLRYRLALVSFRRVSELGDSYAMRRIQEVILGVRTVASGLAEGEAAPS